MPTVAESVSTDMTDVWTLVRALTTLGIWNAEVVTVDSPALDGEEYWVTEDWVIRQGDRIAIFHAQR